MSSPTSAAQVIVAIGGSRHLSPPGLEVARLITHALLSSGHTLAVGCATGTDAAVINAVVALGLAPQLRIFTAFGPVTGSRLSYAVAGSGSCSSPAAVANAKHAGARVSAWAGGGPGLDFPTRLSNRTRAVARAATAGGILVCDGAPGTGSSLLVRSLAARSQPVWLFPVGWVHQFPLPVNGPWSWGWHCLLVNLPCWHLPAGLGQHSLSLAA